MNPVCCFQHSHTDALKGCLFMKQPCARRPGTNALSTFAINILADVPWKTHGQDNSTATQPPAHQRQAKSFSKAEGLSLGTREPEGMDAERLE